MISAKRPISKSQLTIAVALLFALIGEIAVLRGTFRDNAVAISGTCAFLAYFGIEVLRRKS